MRVDHVRLLKQILYGESKDGNRPAHNPKLGFKDCLKDPITQTRTPVGDWEREVKM